MLSFDLKFPSLLLLLLLAHLPTTVHAHAKITSPAIRSPGPEFVASCGQKSSDTVLRDPTGHIEEQEPVNAGCELTLCRGMQFADQPSSNVQSVTPGQQMSMAVDCTIPHGGPANVSLVDTTVGGSGQVIGSFLKTFDDFCPTSGSTPVDQTDLQFNLPNSETVGDKCQNAGDCVVQLFWATPDLSQNYYYCIDVSMAKAEVSSEAPVLKSTPTIAVSSSITPAVAITMPTSSIQTTRMSTSYTGAPSQAVQQSSLSVPTPQSSVISAASAQSQSNSGRRRMRVLWF